jgi:twitching motility protein PilT
LSTLHTTDAAQTVDRIIDIFPHGQQRQIRLQLAQVIEAVLSQALLPRIGGGRAGAFEIMIATTAVRNLIREEKLHELHSVMQLSSKDGMQTLDQALADLVRRRVVTQEDAELKSSTPAQFKKWLQYSVGIV